MLRYEWKKLLFYQKGALYLMALLFAGALLLAATDTPKNSSMEQYREDYEWYLEKLEGACTKEAAEFLEQEAAALADAENKRTKLLDAYYDGELSDAEYQQKNAELDAVLAHKNGFEVIWQQYLYICENTENRYFLQTNGWAGLLAQGSLDFPLFLAVLLLSAAAFCSEYACGMDVLILTSKEGQKSARRKLFLVLALAVSLCMAAAALRYVFFSVKYGLPHAEFPIQSVEGFGGGTKAISLGGAYLAVTALRCFGAVFLALFLMFFSAFVRKYALTLMAGAVSTLIPYIGLSMNAVYRLPIPLPFLLATDFFTGSVYTDDAVSGGQIVSFQEISVPELALLLTVCAGLCVLMAAVLLRRNANQWQPRGFMRRLGAAACAVLLLLSGCAGQEENTAIAYNSSAQNTGDYELLLDETTREYQIRNRNTDETIDLVQSPLFGTFSDEETVMSCYVVEPFVYYTLLETERYVDRVGTYNSSYTRVSVVELDLNTLSERVIFEQVTDSGRSLLGIDYEVGDRWRFLQLHSAFFLNADDIFFVGSQGITAVSRRTEAIRAIEIPTTGNLAFDGQHIFYLNERSVLCRYDTKSYATIPLDNVIASDFYLDGQQILYISRTDQYRVYACNPNGTNCRMLSDVPASGISVDEAGVSITSRDTGEVITVAK